MTFFEVVLATILGQLILIAVLGIVKGITGVIRDHQKEKLKKSTDNLIESLNKLKQTMEYLKKEEKEDKKDE